MANELRLCVFANAALHPRDGESGLGESNFLLQRGWVHGRGGGTALCVRFPMNMLL